MRVTLTYDTFVIKCVWRIFSVCSFFMVLITEVVLAEQIRVLRQRGTDFLLLLKATGVGDLHVAAFGGRFINNLLQFGIQMAVHIWRGIVARKLLIPSITAILSWDLIQHLGLRLLLA